MEEVEKRHRLKLLTPFLEHLISEGSTDPHVHNALGEGGEVQGRRRLQTRTCTVHRVRGRKGGRGEGGEPNCLIFRVWAVHPLLS